MKKYPFSKKAMKAMLAATIALSPLAATGIATPVKVEAANNFSSEETLINYLDCVYDTLSDTQKGYLKTASGLLNSQDWDSLANELSTNPGGTATAQEKELLADLAELFVQASMGGLDNFKNKLELFKTNNAGKIDIVFGGNITINELVNFLADVELEYIKELGKITNTPSNEGYFDLFKTTLENKATENKDNLFVAFAISTKINFDNPDVKVEVKKIVNNVDPNADARNAFLAAVKEVDSCTAPGGGGGGTPPPQEKIDTTPVVEEKGNNVISVIPSEKVQEIVNQITDKKSEIGIKLEKVTADKQAKAEVPAALFTEAAKKNSKAVVAIESEAAVYKLPVSEINVADLATKLGVAASDVKISVSVNVVPATVTNSVADVVEFTVIAESGDKQYAITAFSTYVERVLIGKKDFSKGNSVAVRVNQDGSLSSIPTLFDGKNATAKSLTNSKYTVVENNFTFKDVTSKSWAKGYIETLANKLIVKGKAANQYAPADHMTRAEFTVMLVRALGLPGETYNKHFKDIKGTEWYNENGEIMAAVKNGLIQGVGNGKFAPQEKITRAQAAVMIERAMNINFIGYDKSQLDSNKKATDFKDAAKFKDWNKSAIEAVYQANIVSGRDTKEFDPNGYTQRDEMAKILANFLTSAKLMN